VNEFAGGYPGYDGLISRTTASVAKVLNYIGYNTFHLGECNTDVLDTHNSSSQKRLALPRLRGVSGKSHNTPIWHKSQAGPQNLFPSRFGFEKFYGAHTRP
jgi:hypothetical protein